MKPSEFDEHFARQAIELARQARLSGNHPFGALLPRAGRNPPERALYKLRTLRDVRR